MEDVPWIEKYRPRVLNDVVGNEEIIQRLKLISLKGNIPNMLLCGSPGIGKTTTIMCLINEVLGERNRSEATLELNASDDRGIDVIRTKIKNFSSKKIYLEEGQHKVVILDEADNMTPAAQQALRRIIEIYSSTTRFIFSCNQSEKIIEPLQSRCVILRYVHLKEEEVARRVVHISKKEGVRFSGEGIEAVCFTSDGDMRQAINNLQSTYHGYGFVNEENVYSICDIPHPKRIEEIVLSCYSKDFEKAISSLKILIKEGYSRIDLIKIFFRVSKKIENISEEYRLKLLSEIGKTHMRILEGVEKRQLEAMLAKISITY